MKTASKALFLNISKQKLNTLMGFFPLVIALFLTIFDNASLWKELFRIKGGFSYENMAYFMPFFIFMLLLFTLFFVLIRFKYLLKTVAILIVLTASIAAYFMDAYGIMLDKSMIQNSLETDISETGELITLQLLFYFCLLGVLPAFVIVRMPFYFKPVLKQLSSNLLITLAILIIPVIILVIHYGDYASLYRSNRHIRHMINPVNYVKAIASNISRLTQKNAGPLTVLGVDATIKSSLKNQRKKTLTIMVVGETARAKNFSLNGYARTTNPLLSQEDIIFYNNFYSCGTATATSVPCMFSYLRHDNYDDSEAKQTEGLLDVLKHAGVNVLWRNNNSGCKGVCDRVEFEDMSALTDQQFCNSSECFDEILLQGLQDYVDGITEDSLIILHQKGSHGPSYHLRVPPEFEQFIPICKSSQVNDCTQESLVNAYDNTILYTDYFLGQVIQFLKKNSAQFNTAMIYASDHGESLGENNMFLHGLPYLLAPDEQIHVPMVLWLSKGLNRDLNINSDCLKEKSTTRYSHDNLFHSLLGIMNTKTHVYDSGLDIFSNCRG